MKTLREALFEKHQAAEPKLDAIREQVVADLTSGRNADTQVRSTQRASAGPPGASALQTGWRQFVWSLRWHLAGLSAAWLVALVLNIDNTPELAQGVTRQDSPSPRQLLVALRENQRQLRALIAAPASEPAPEPSELTPSPRSQIQSFPIATT
jgi:hypothetical protein